MIGKPFHKVQWAGEANSIRTGRYGTNPIWLPTAATPALKPGATPRQSPREGRDGGHNPRPCKWAPGPCLSESVAACLTFNSECPKATRHPYAGESLHNCNSPPVASASGSVVSLLCCRRANNGGRWRSSALSTVASILASNSLSVIPSPAISRLSFLPWACHSGN